MFVGVSERDEAVFRVHFGFMYAADCPLTSVVEPAFKALTARELERSVFFAIIFFGPGYGLTVSFKADGSRGCAGHLACPLFFLEPDAAAHFSRVQSVEFVVSSVRLK